MGKQAAGPPGRVSPSSAVYYRRERNRLASLQRTISPCHLRFLSPLTSSWSHQSKWPYVGEPGPDPARRAEPWRVRVSGLVARPQTWSVEELWALPQVEARIDIHCVTRWSKPGARFSGVPLQTVLDACQPLAQARFVSFVARSARSHSTSLALADALALDTLLALSYEGRPLAERHGGPIRTVVRERYFYKSLKWLEEIRVLAEDELGYWEKEAGYHNRADPWQEQRYIVPHIDNRLYRRLLKARDFRPTESCSASALTVGI